MCEWPSTSPGVSVAPGRSITFAPAAATLASAPTASMRSPFTRTAHPSCIVSPSNTRAGFSTVIVWSTLPRPPRTCAAYQTHMRPVFGQQIAWGESNAISFANSVIGARTERYPDLLDICCAITGRVPAVGLHLTENRAGQLLLRLAGVPQALQQDDQFFAVLGHLVGTLAYENIPVIDGIAVSPAEDQLNAF